MIHPHLTKHGVRIYMIGNQPQCITMHKQTVNGNCTLSGKCTSRDLIVETIVTREHIPVNGIIHLHIVKCFTISQNTIIENTVTRQFLAFVGQHGTIQQFSLLCSGIINTSFGIDVVLITHNIRRTQNRSNLRIGAIFQGIRSQYKFRINQLHIMVEYGYFRGRTIFPPLGSQHILFIGQCTAIEVITQIIQTVVV